jgi:hypothetical protein
VKIISMPLLAVAFCLTPSLMSTQIAQQLFGSGVFPLPFRNWTMVTSGNEGEGSPRRMGRAATGHTSGLNR